MNTCLRLDRKGTPLTSKVDWFNLDVDSSTDDNGSPPPLPPRTKKTPAAKKPAATKAPPKPNATKQPTADEEEHILSDDTGEKFAIRTSKQAFSASGYLWQKILPRSKMQARYRPVTTQPQTQSDHTFTFGRHNVVRKNHFALGPSTAWSAVPVKLESSSSAPPRVEPQKPGPVTSTIPPTLTNSGPISQPVRVCNAQDGRSTWPWHQLSQSRGTGQECQNANPAPGFAFTSSTSPSSSFAATLSSAQWLQLAATFNSTKGAILDSEQ